MSYPKTIPRLPLHLVYSLNFRAAPGIVLRSSFCVNRTPLPLDMTNRDRAAKKPFSYLLTSNSRLLSTTFVLSALSPPSITRSRASRLPKTPCIHSMTATPSQTASKHAIQDRVRSESERVRSLDSKARSRTPDNFAAALMPSSNSSAIPTLRLRG
jgi:hypothetical protein